VPAPASASAAVPDRRRRPATGAAIMGAIIALATLAAGCGVSGASGVVLNDATDCASISPSPGSATASPSTEVTVRGVDASSLVSGHVAIVGNRSARHAGRWLPDADRRGGAFASVTPFTPGERVTVILGVPICGSRGERASFAIAGAP